MNSMHTSVMGHPTPSSSAAASLSSAKAAGSRTITFLGSSQLRNVSHQVLLPFVGAQRNAVVLTLGDGSRMSGSENSRRHAIVTGANSGIGKATALELAKKGMVVTLACRNEESGKAAAEEISQATNNTSVRSMTVDLGSLQSVRQFVAEYKDSGLPLHVLVNNAGIMACPQAYTADNFERQLGDILGERTGHIRILGHAGNPAKVIIRKVNHLGHFLLTSLLIDVLVASASTEQKSRVVVLASAAERIGEIDFRDINYKGSRAYNNWTAYGQSKLANCLFSYELAKRSRKLALPIISNSMHPGVVNTRLIRYVLPGISKRMDESPKVPSLLGFLFRAFGLKTPEEGASTAVFLASSPEIENSSGLYYENSKESNPTSNATDPGLASKLWDMSVELTESSSALEPLGLTEKLLP